MSNTWEFLKPCECEARYTIEPHGDGYALYYGRCNHRHGYNLINMVELLEMAVIKSVDSTTKML